MHRPDRYLAVRHSPEFCSETELAVLYGDPVESYWMLETSGAEVEVDNFDYRIESRIDLIRIVIVDANIHVPRRRCTRQNPSITSAERSRQRLTVGRASPAVIRFRYLQHQDRCSLTIRFL